MKNKIKIIIWFLLIVIITIFSTVPIEKKHHQTTWMKDLSDDTLINDMSIPGTHDSGARHSIFDVAGICQDLSIKNQLNIGVRFLDLRLQLVNDEFKIVHSFVDQNLKFSDVLKDITKFIKENNQEFLLISIKKEADDVNSKQSFSSALSKELAKYEEISTDVLPNTLGLARGKIYILSRCDLNVGINAYYGWSDSTTFVLDNLYIQDNYCIDEVLEKQEDIIKTLNYSKDNNDKLVLNFTSCYLDNAFPPSYAGTPANTINPWLINYLENFNGDTGIIITDFITKNLAESIYMRNFR